jgi:catechol 2,3-dioxygenase-like lactoylglutathione lyase family enzyme
MARDNHGSGLDSLELTLDAADVERAAEFWAAALGYRVLHHRDLYVVLGPRHEAGLRLVVQRVEQRRTGKSPVHLDLRVREPVREVERLVRLGARVQQVVEEAGRSRTVMTDPEGTVFGVCPARWDHEGPARPEGAVAPSGAQRPPFP